MTDIVETVARHLWPHMEATKAYPLAETIIDTVHAHYVALAADQQVLETALKDGGLGPIAAKRAFLAMLTKMKEIST